MGEVAREAFVEFREDEIADLYAFLRARFGHPIAAHRSTNPATQAGTR